MRQHLRRSANALFSRTAWRVRLVLWGGALLLGAVATGFATSSEYANEVFLAAIGYSPWVALLLCPLGLMLVAWLTRTYFPGSQGSGIPQTLAALETTAKDGLRDKVLSLRIAVGKVLLALIGLCSGASIGREGPTVHVGAALMYSMGKAVRFPPHYMERALITAGGAAGIAAAFNTPLAGVVFAIEEIGRSFEEKTSGIVLTGVIFAGMTAMVILGNYNYFGTTSAHLDHYSAWLAIPVCGVIGGLLGGLFSQALISGSRLLKPLADTHPVWLAGACGLIVALVGLYSGNLVYGTGYTEAREIVISGETIRWDYPLLKMVASIASYLSGIPGGIFAPSLAAGAGVGSDLAAWFPHIPTAAVVILGMVAYFTGVVQTPITAFVIVMEMTDNHGMLLPLMATAFIARGASGLVCPEPIYRELALNFIPEHLRKKR